MLFLIYLCLNINKKPLNISLSYLNPDSVQAWWYYQIPFVNFVESLTFKNFKNWYKRELFDDDKLDSTEGSPTEYAIAPNVNEGHYLYSFREAEQNYLNDLKKNKFNKRFWEHTPESAIF